MKIKIDLGDEKAAKIKAMAKELGISAEWLQRILSRMALVSMGTVTKRRLVANCSFASLDDAARAAKLVLESSEEDNFGRWAVDTYHDEGKKMKKITWVKPKARKFKVLEGNRNVRVCPGIAA